MRQFKEKVYPIERIIAFLTYLTAGLVGFIWLIIAALCKKSITKFVMYHILQSLFLSIAYFLLVSISNLMYGIPIVNAIPYFINMSLSILWGYSILQLFSSLIMIYLLITSVMGLYSYIPWVSDIINQNIRR